MERYGVGIRIYFLHYGAAGIVDGGHIEGELLSYQRLHVSSCLVERQVAGLSHDQTFEIFEGMKRVVDCPGVELPPLV